MSCSHQNSNTNGTTRSATVNLGALYIFYDLSRRVTVRVQTGEQSAINLVFAPPYG
ncbi:hypothetical protein [Rhodoferax sp.]|uniref:hypothetical protein n=1 Tax=Rhodoferax sp. TaxID=50421 RepID=UPI00276C8107|nr:hypothetical protein [Rhodoferax sp.]